MTVEEILERFENEASKELVLIRSKIEEAYSRYAALKAVEEELILEDAKFGHKAADQLDIDYPEWRQKVIDSLRTLR